MKRRTFQRVFLSLVLALVLVPVLGGVFCHCAHAEASTQEHIESPMCRGCCPESIAAPDHHAILTQSPALFLQASGNLEIENLSLAGSSAGRVLQDGARGLLGDTPPASLFSATPLYLLNLVLRF